MLAHYLVLGLPPSATGEEIRRRYLELVRKHRVGRDLQRLQQITAAYEALKDDRARVKTALFGMAAGPTVIGNLYQLNHSYSLPSGLFMSCMFAAFLMLIAGPSLGGGKFWVKKSS